MLRLLHLLVVLVFECCCNLDYEFTDVNIMKRKNNDRGFGLKAYMITRELVMILMKKIKDQYNYI